MSNTITEFKGQYSFLSNFYVLNDETINSLWGYPSVEHFYQAMKTKNETERLQFKNKKLTAAGSKKLGRTITLREDWEDIKVDVMKYALALKFRKGSYLAAKLIETEDSILIEGNYWHDNYWGGCICNRCANKPKINMLGKLLMEQRQALKE